MYVGLKYRYLSFNMFIRLKYQWNKNFCIFFSISNSVCVISNNGNPEFRSLDTVIWKQITDKPLLSPDLKKIKFWYEECSRIEHIYKTQTVEKTWSFHQYDALIPYPQLCWFYSCNFFKSALKRGSLCSCLLCVKGLRILYWRSVLSR